VKLPMQLYVSLHDRQLSNHISFLVSRLLEEFLKATDVRISWAEMPTKAEQREYLERKLKEFFSQNGLPTELPKPPVQERTKQAEMPAELPKSPAEAVRPPVQEKSPPTYVQEKPKDVFESAKPEPVKEEKTSPPEKDDWDDDILKRIESLW